MKKMTREEIDRKLEQLRGTRLNNESYLDNHYIINSCYCVVSISNPDDEKEKPVERICHACKTTFDVVSTYCDRRHSIADYEDVVQEFRQLGLQTEFILHCNACAKKHHLPHYEMRIKAFDEDAWHISIPDCESCMYAQEHKHTKFVSYEEYRLVLDFLHAKEIDDVPAVFDRLYNIEFAKVENVEFIDFYAEKNLTILRALALIKRECVEFDRFGYSDYKYREFLSGFNAFAALTYEHLGNTCMGSKDYRLFGCIKTKIDTALSKVLGLAIIYDKEEVRKHLSYLYAYDAIETVYALLDRCNKSTFTVEEYNDFLNSIFHKVHR